MEKEFNTLTYGKLPLQIDMGHGKLIPKGVEVKAIVDMQTGQVTFKVSQEDLEKLRNS
ncbi:hypothetical protein [Streptococcus equi]|uniref:hypothetical protein n=1 Tax=Streptococcus equi TaxID=1336 RepID=UPI0002FD71E8|nr:hypothetical protein [Streptococcus equi]HEK9991456.1 hypothetical protein [Streptococcus equi subsp. zooepidemicus]ASB97272.1 hypothetical protein SE071780_01683 [Streptococcus equi subsp. equi]MBT1194760.1 hypothetical protein [Streptococcus equi subsp. equi]MBT1196798.1 hypothetical protein [Streptococcus equi subsp. equi]MBT1199543.1 hypothetical protein [Streptococcus equi subsp. equi]